jgi:predicted transcriptional regulator
MANSPTHLLLSTAQIVSAYLSRNAVPAGQLSKVIEAVGCSLADVAGDISSAPLPGSNLERPTEIAYQSVFPDHIVCLEDGMSVKTLKRHLHTAHQMTPQQYRAKWGLPPDYPMVAPGYAHLRSDLAKISGLGKKRQQPTVRRNTRAADLELA